MRSIMGAVVGIVVAVAGMTGMAADQGGPLILNEGSLWRGWITWMPAITRDTNGVVKQAQLWNGLGQASALPPQDWMKPEFDDSGWFYYREIHFPKTFKNDKTEDPSVPVYDIQQYGIQRSVYTGIRCLRTAFTVTEPAKAQDLKLSLAFRGGMVVYVNGQEVGRANVPKDARLAVDAPADDYPDESSMAANNQPIERIDLARITSDLETVKRLNTRIRRLQVNLPASVLRKGSNVLALEIHRSPYFSNVKRVEGAGNWSACGLATAELRGSGVEPALSRPKGLQVWNVNSITRITPFCGTSAARTWAGGAVFPQYNPLSWGMPNATLKPIRIAGTRNGVFVGQVGVTSDEPIRGLNATMSDLVHSGGGSKIPASFIQVCYQGYPEAYPKHLAADPAISFMDILYDKPPAEIPVRQETRGGERAREGMPLSAIWSDGGALAPVWIKVRVPSDAAVGDYTGKLTIKVTGAKESVVPVKLQVADWKLPQPRDFVTHVGAMHSPDTVAIQYKAPCWSDKHFELMEKSLSYSGELGGKLLFIPMVINATWLMNERSMVCWVKQPDGSYKYDFKLFDRYLDLVQKYHKPEVVCLYVTDGGGRSGIGGVNAPDGSVIPVPPYEPKAESVAFWKPAIAETKERLAKRGLGDAAMIGLLWEQNANDAGKNAVDLFKEAAPGMKLVQIAHYGGQKGENYGVPYGYAMSVWGNCTPFKSKVFGARDIPIKVAWNPRADALNDIRPVAPLGAFRFIMERTGGTIGLGPIGMDFWNVPKAREGAGAWNLSMSGFTTAGLLAPGADGPLSTARFEMLRESLQECEARRVIELALADAASKGKMGDALAAKCKAVLDERTKFADFAGRGEWFTEGEGWQWFASSGWEDRSLSLFNCAGEVSKALGTK